MLKTNDVLKKILYIIASLLLLATFYFGYDWYKSDPNNKEPLPFLLALGSTFATLIIAFINEKNGDGKNNVSVKNIRESPLIDVDPKDNTNYQFKNIKGENTRIYIGKGKDSLNNDATQNNPS